MVYFGYIFSMNNYIENLKTKPNHIRKRFAFLVSSGVTFVIFAGWIASYGITSTSALAQKDEEGKVKIEAPVSSLTASVGGFFSDIKSMFSSSNKVEYSSDAIEVVGGGK